jgi:hypothetical protein
LAARSLISVRDERSGSYLTGTAPETPPLLTAPTFTLFTHGKGKKKQPRK